jgi:hypothetical protein
MRQTWDEQEPNQGDYLRLLKRERDEGYTPHRTANMWRRRFWCSIALNVLLMVVFWLVLLRGRP